MFYVACTVFKKISKKQVLSVFFTYNPLFSEKISKDLALLGLSSATETTRNNDCSL